jgi:hypothetical protein
MTTSNMFIGARDGLTITASNDMLVSASNDLTVSACNNLTLKAKDMTFDMSGNLTYKATSNINFFIAQSSNGAVDPTVIISPDRINVRGDLWITGTINTNNIINTTVVQENLKVQDKVILLAAQGEEGGAPNEGLATNDGAGIVVDGLPIGESNTELYRKSFTWDYGAQGTIGLGSSNTPVESAWELLGGGLRITCKKLVSGSIRDVSFTWRVNEQDELELVKKFWNAVMPGHLSMSTDLSRSPKAALKLLIVPVSETAPVTFAVPAPRLPATVPPLRA